MARRNRASDPTIGDYSSNIGYTKKSMNALSGGNFKSFRSGASRDTSTHSGNRGYSKQSLAKLGQRKTTRKYNGLSVDTKSGGKGYSLDALEKLAKGGYKEPKKVRQPLSANELNNVASKMPRKTESENKPLAQHNLPKGNLLDMAKALEDKSSFSGGKGYSDKSLKALESGKYTDFQKESRSKVPSLKPSTRYTTNVLPQETTEVTTSNSGREHSGSGRSFGSANDAYKEDFDNFFDYREGDFSGVVNYDPATDTQYEAWRDIKKDIMKKYGWTEKEFDEKYAEYSNKRYTDYANQMVEMDYELAQKHPVIGTGLSFVQTPGVWLEGMANALTGLPFIPEEYKAQSADDPRFMIAREKAALRQGAREQIDANTGNDTVNGILNTLGRGAYDMGTSVGDMFLAAGLPILGTAVLGTEAASRQQMQALERGVDPNKAAATGALSGLVSAFMNKVGFDKAMAATSNTALGAALEAANREGFENIGEDAANLIIDYFINGNQSEVMALRDYYIGQGLSEGDAWKNVYNDIRRDMATSYGSGALFGGLMHAGRNLPSLLQEIGDMGRKPASQNVAPQAEARIPEVTTEIDRERAQYEQAASEIEALRNLIPALRNTEEGYSDGQLSPEEVRVLQDVVDGKYDIPETGESAPKYINESKGIYKIPDNISDIAAENREQIKTMKAVATIKTGMFKDGEGDIPTKVSEYWAKWGNKAHNDVLGDIALTKRAAKSSLSHNKLTRRKVDTFAAVPDVIENGKVIDYQPSWKGRDYDTAIIVAPTIIEDSNSVGEEYITAVIVRRNKNSQKFYTHDAVSVKKSEPSLETQETSSDIPSESKGSSSVYSILRKIADDKFEYDNGPDANIVPTVKPTEQAPAQEVPRVEPTPPSNDENIRSFSERGSKDKTLPKEVRDVLKEDYYKVIHNKDVEQRAEELFNPNDLAQTRSNLEQLMEQKDPASALLSYKLAGAYVDAKQYDAATDVLRQVSEQLTRAGQFTQAAKLAMVKNDPMAALRMFQRDLTSVNEWGKQKYGKKWQDLKMKAEDIEAFKNVKKGDAEGLANLVDNLNGKYAKQIPATWWDKVVGATKTAMLLNPRTQIRNIAANTAVVPIRSFSDRVSALGQNVAHLINPDVEVTQSLVGGTKEQKTIAGQIFDLIKDSILGENKMKDSVKSDIIARRQIFNDDFFAKWVDEHTTGLKINELTGADANQSTMETLQNFTYWLMGDFGDTPFVKKNFVNRLASYMKAQGITNIEDVPDDAIALATTEALKATFKDDNKFTKALEGMKKKSGKFGEVALPFVKTPANLTMRAIDYSPAGVINSIRKIRSGADASAVIDDLSKNLTGSMMIMLGIALRNGGVLSGNYSENDDEKAFQKRSGMLENAFHIGDKYYSFDWAQPAATPLIIGSVIADAMNASDKENKSVIDTMFKGSLNVANSLIDSSPLQTLSEMLGGNGYSKNGVAGNIANAMVEFPQRFIPSILGANARVNDPVIRDTYIPDDSLTGILKNQVNVAKSKIPFLSKTLPASYDTWGNERKRSDSYAEGVFSQYINPGQTGQDNSTPIDADIQAIYDATGNKEVFPKAAERNLKLGNDGNIKLTNEQHSEYQKKLGQLSYQFAEGLLENEDFQELSDDQKAAMLGNAYDFANQISKEELFDYYTDDNKRLREAYEEGDVDGAIEYWMKKSKADELGMDIDTYDKWSTDPEKVELGGPEAYAKSKAKVDKVNEKYGTNFDNDAYIKYGKDLEQRAKDKVEVDKINEKYGTTYDADDYAKYGKDLEKRAQNKKDLDELNEKYGSKMQMDDYLEYGSKEKAEQHLKNREAAKRAGFVTKNKTIQTDEYERYISEAGWQSKKMERDLPKLADAGLGKSAYHTYAQAIQEVPALKPNEFAKTYKSMDTDGSGGLKQDEIIAYLNRVNASQADANKYWRAYGDSEWKKHPVWNGSKWVKK